MRAFLPPPSSWRLCPHFPSQSEGKKCPKSDHFLQIFGFRQPHFSPSILTPPPHTHTPYAWIKLWQALELPGLNSSHLLSSFGEGSKIVKAKSSKGSKWSLNWKCCLISIPVAMHKRYLEKQTNLALKQIQGPIIHLISGAQMELEI